MTSRTMKTKAFAFVRVRPLLKIDYQESDKDTDEIESSILDGLVTETSFSEPVYAMKGNLPISGFTGVLGLVENNLKVFQDAFFPQLTTVMEGGTSSLFCYGYTGAGKTHTTLGYGSDPGLYRLAVTELLKRVATVNEDVSTNSEESIETEPLILQASAIEVYNDDVFDILAGRAQCSLRKNHKGQLLVRGATQKVSIKKEDDVDYAVLTKNLSAIRVQSEEDLDQIQKTALEHRAVGFSSKHSQSSRSHAIFRIDIVNQTLLNAMNELEEAQSIKPALQTAYDKQKTYQLRHKVLDIERRIQERQKFIDGMYLASIKRKSPFGGRLILVDLAGADSDSRSIVNQELTLSQRKETAAINKSLMALKECIRGLQSSQPSRSLPFRNSSLTRLLEEVLTPMEKRESNCVMVVNVSPAHHLKLKTIASLRYGAMFSTTAKKASRLGSVSAVSRRKVGRNIKSSRSQPLLEAKRRMQQEMQICSINNDLDVCKSLRDNSSNEVILDH